MLLIIDNNCVAGQKYYRAAPSLWLVRLNGIIAERFCRRVSVEGCRWSGLFLARPIWRMDFIVDRILEIKLAI